MNGFMMDGNINTRENAAETLRNAIENAFMEDIEVRGHMRKYHAPLRWRCGECAIFSEMELDIKPPSLSSDGFEFAHCCELEILSDTRDTITSIRFDVFENGEVDADTGLVIYDRLIEAVNTAIEVQDYERFRALVGFMVSLATDEAVFRAWHEL